ncbi:MAG: STAS domain-containing protein [Actinoplanes sp.]
MAVEQPPQSSLRMQVTSAGLGEVCVAVTGDLDVYTAGLLAEQVRETICRHCPASVLLDLERLEFIDVAGVRSLQGMHADAAVLDCMLIIRHAPGMMLWIQSVLGLDGVFEPPALPERRAEPGS